MEGTSNAMKNASRSRQGFAYIVPASVFDKFPFPRTDHTVFPLPIPSRGPGDECLSCDNTSKAIDPRYGATRSRACPQLDCRRESERDIQPGSCCRPRKELQLLSWECASKPVWTRRTRRRYFGAK